MATLPPCPRILLRCSLGVSRMLLTTNEMEDTLAGPTWTPWALVTQLCGSQQR